MNVDLNQTAIDRLSHAVETLLNPCTEESLLKRKTFFIYIKRLLNRQQIKCVEVEDVITEIYFRAFNYVKKNGKDIENIIPFLKRIALNYVRELSRSQKKYLSYDPIVLDEQLNSVHTNVDGESFVESLSENQLQRFHLVLAKLSWSDYLILELWQIQEMPWKEIVDELKKRGKFLSPVSARKKGQRIMKKLKQEMDL